jgi:low temperature requirement protein LtrA
MVAGVIVAAVGDELVIAHPTETLGTAQVIAVVAGAAIDLVATRCSGCAWPARSRSSAWPAPRRVCWRARLARFAPGWVLQALTVAILAAVIAAERIAGRRRAARGEPSPLELLDAGR